MGMISDLWIKLSLKKDGFDKGLDQSKNKVSQFSSGIKKIGGLIAGAFAIGSITSFLMESQKLAGETENVRKAFVRLGGGSYFKELNEATRGTLSQVDLMKNTIQATNFGIPIKDLANLFKFATERAAQTGQSVEYLTQSIVMGIGRKSVLILDNLGISAVQLREKLKKVGEETATVGDVAEAIGSIAEEQFKRMGEQATTTAQKLDDVKGSWTDIKVAIGDAINQNDIFLGGVKLLSGYFDVFSKQAENAMTNAGSRVKKFMDLMPKNLTIEEKKTRIKSEISGIDQKISDTESGMSWTQNLTMGGKRNRDEAKHEIATLKNQAIELTGIFDTLKATPEKITVEQRISDLTMLIALEKKLATQKGQSTEEALTHANAIKKAEEELADLLKIQGIADPKDNAYVKLLDEIKKKQSELNQLPKQSVAYYEAEISLLKAKQAIITDPQLFEASQKELRVKEDLLEQLKGELKLLELKKSKIKDIRDLVYIKENPSDRQGADKLDMGGSMLANIQNSNDSADAYNEKIAEAKAFVQNMKDTLNGGMADVVGTMAEGFGQLLTDSDFGWDDFGSSLLQSVGGFMVQFGKLLIAYAIAASGLIKAIANPGAWPIALAAGIALVGIGTAISGMGSKGLSGSSSSGGGGSYTGASGYNPRKHEIQAVNVGGTFELHGTVLKAAIHNSDRKNNLIR